MIRFVQRLWQRTLSQPAVVLAVMTAILCFAANHLLVITDPVESNYALTAKEMLASGDYFSPRIFGNYWYDKPIFFYWELIAAFKLFGISNFCCPLLPGPLRRCRHPLGLRLYGPALRQENGIFHGPHLADDVEYSTVQGGHHRYDLFVFYSACLMAFYIAYSEKRPSFYYAAYAFAGLAVLTKGPIGLLQPGLIILLFLLWRRDLKALLHIKMVSGLLLFLAITAVWYVPMYSCTAVPLSASSSASTTSCGRPYRNIRDTMSGTITVPSS